MNRTFIQSVSMTILVAAGFYFTFDRLDRIEQLHITEIRNLKEIQSQTYDVEKAVRESRQSVTINGNVTANSDRPIVELKDLPGTTRLPSPPDQWNHWELESPDTEGPSI